MPAHHRLRYVSPFFSFVLCAIFFMDTGPLIAQSTVPSSQEPDSQSAKPKEGGQAPAVGGSNTGGAHPAVFDNERRPITAGGFVKDGPVIFQDIAQKAGLTEWTHMMGTAEKKFIIETNGSGVGLIDYDNDGWLDIYLVNGSTFDALDGKDNSAPCGAVSQQSRRHLYRCGREGWRDQRPLGFRRGHRRLRQRWLAGHLCHQLRQEPALSQQP